MKRFFVAILASAWVIGVALTLIIVTTLRPWASANKNWETHLNFLREPPQGYTRSGVQWIDATPAALEGWDVHEGVHSSNQGQVLFVARGCAACHGIEGDGTGAAGPSVLGASQRVITRVVRNGPGGMPAYNQTDMSDEELALITQYISSLGAAPTPTPPNVTPTATPWPKPTPTPTQTPVPTATPTRTPIPVPTATLAPGVTPSPTPIPQPTATPTPTPVATATPVPTPTSSGGANAGKQLYSDVGCAACHGADGKGGPIAPPVIRFSADQIRTAAGNGDRIPGSKYPRPMSPITVGDLSNAELDQIIQYMLTLK